MITFIYVFCWSKLFVFITFTAAIILSLPSGVESWLGRPPWCYSNLRPAAIGYPRKQIPNPDPLIFRPSKPMATLSAEIKIQILMVNLPICRSSLPAGAGICNYHAPLFHPFSITILLYWGQNFQYEDGKPSSRPSRRGTACDNSTLHWTGFYAHCHLHFLSISYFTIPLLIIQSPSKCTAVWINRTIFT